MASEPRNRSNETMQDYPLAEWSQGVTEEVNKKENKLIRFIVYTILIYSLLIVLGTALAIYIGGR